MPIWIPGKIIKIQYWTKNLFSITITAAIDPFTAGQFSRIGIKINNKFTQRAYSYLNPPNDPHIEFYITKIITGKLTTALYTLRPGNTILISKESYGKFILNEIPNQRKFLWMISTGTEISPYLSILESFDKKLHQFLKIILIHATSFSENLNYLSKMIILKKLYNDKLIIQTILSREHSSNSLYGHIPDLIKNDILENKIGIHINSNSHIMLCGNPYMIIDTKNVLNKKYGMKNHSKKNIGHITQERFW